MGSVLVVSSTDKGRDFFSDLLNSRAYEKIVIAGSGGEARRLLLENDFDLIVINTPLKDEFGQELALSAVDCTTAGILMIVKAELADSISEKVEDYGILVIPKPLSRQIFFQSIKLVSISRNRIALLQKQNDKLQRKIEEIRLVDRAKCALIQYRNLTEQEAHRLIEKKAMDTRCSRRAVAEEILKTFEG